MATEVGTRKKTRLGRNRRDACWGGARHRAVTGPPPPPPKARGPRGWCPRTAAIASAAAVAAPVGGAATTLALLLKEEAAAVRGRRGHPGGGVSCGAPGVKTCRCGVVEGVFVAACIFVHRQVLLRIAPLRPVLYPERTASMNYESTSPEAICFSVHVLYDAGPAAVAPLPAVREVRGHLRPPLQGHRHLHWREESLPLLVVSAV